MIVPLWILKVGFALLDTPFVYLGVRWLASEKYQIYTSKNKNTGFKDEDSISRSVNSILENVNSPSDYIPSDYIKLR